MSNKILSEMGKEDVNLSIISIIIDSQRIGDEGMQVLCFQSLSHVTQLRLGKRIDTKVKIN
jgi:hypothetical protein